MLADGELLSSYQEAVRLKNSQGYRNGWYLLQTEETFSINLTVSCKGRTAFVLNANLQDFKAFEHVRAVGGADGGALRLVRSFAAARDGVCSCGR